MRISKNALQFLLVIILTAFPAMGFANPAESPSRPSSEETPASKEEEDAFSASELINEHIGDSHDFHIADFNGHPIALSLPVILWTRNGLTVFSSEAFQHDNTGTHVVSKNGQDFVRYNEVIFYKDRFDTLSQEDKDAFNFDARPLDFSITKNVFSLLMSALLILLLFSAVARSYKKNQLAPKGLAGFLEPLVTFVRDDIAIPNIGPAKYARYMPYLLTVFFFIWTNNLIGLVPFFPFGSNLTGNIFFTFVLALITFIVTTLSANQYYWKHILSPSVPRLLYLIMVPIEIIGMFTKPFALMIRLFANITAGHIIILSLVSLIFIFNTVAIAPVSGAFVLFMSVLELLVAALQAYVFTLLTALFIGQAVEVHEHH